MEKISIIDIGSNIARIVIANIMDGGYFNVIDELKESVQITKGLETDGILHESRIEQLIVTLNSFKALSDSHQVNKTFAYITSAISDARNKKTFLETVLTRSGIKLTILSQEEECEYVHNGVVNSLDIPKGFIIDIGGSTIKLIHYNRKQIVNHSTLPIGCVSLTEKFMHIKDPNERSSQIEQYVTSELDKIEWLSTFTDETTFVGVGGSIRNLGKISRKFKHYPINSNHNYRLDLVDDFENIYNTLKAIDITGPARIKGISASRAELLPAATSCIKAIKEKLDIKELVISCCGFREGKLFRYAVPSTAEKPIQDILGHSIFTMLNVCNLYPQHSLHVYDLASQLYRNLKVLHKFPKNYLKVMRAASQLHDIGCAYNYYNHSAHSFYYILNSSLFGLTHKEILMAAIIAGLHGNGSANDIPNLQQYLSLLTQEELVAVKKMSVILRIAESFDRSMSGVITEITCDILGDSVILKTEAREGADKSLEIRDASQVIFDFKNVFGKSLNIL
ncbi:MAG: Ppx/GppA family phosphatase [Clostridia bacterium]|nr:Ppx/GppA family phosphatase [Clostridia bacterium]